ncbi:MAG: hypothetical protein BHV65_12745, partial [Alistipes sp. 58_9_plus]
MTIMKKIFQLCAVLAVMFAVTGCYNDFDAPKPAKVYTDEDFAGMKHISIADVKQMFLDEHKSLGGTGSNSSWGDTKYVQIGQSPDGLDYYIKGKVQSSDEEGNVYKSLYLVDDSGAIEVKLTTGLYFTYPMGRFDKATGTIPSNWVYVKVSGLYIGNYRMMLSLGEGPTDSYNKVGEHKFYANSNIEDPTEIRKRVFLGGETQLELGRTVGSNIYPAWMYTDIRPVMNKVWYRWAFSNAGTNLYGSVLFTYDSTLPSTTNKKGVYTVRTSGYSRFAQYPVVRDGAKGDIMAIFGIYSKDWTYNYGAYQCTVNYFDDIMFDEDVFLTEAEVEQLTPADSWVT